MEHIERAIGKLQATVELTREDVVEIKKEVKLLSQFKWRIAGGAIVVSVFVSILVEAVHFATALGK